METTDHKWIDHVMFAQARTRVEVMIKHGAVKKWKWREDKKL